MVVLLILPPQEKLNIVVFTLNLECQNPIYILKQ